MTDCVSSFVIKKKTSGTYPHQVLNMHKLWLQIQSLDIKIFVRSFGKLHSSYRFSCLTLFFYRTIMWRFFRVAHYFPTNEMTGIQPSNRLPTSGEGKGRRKRPPIYIPRTESPRAGQCSATDRKHTRAKMLLHNANLQGFYSLYLFLSKQYVKNRNRRSWSSRGRNSECVFFLPKIKYVDLIIPEDLSDYVLQYANLTSAFHR